MSSSPNHQTMRPEEAARRFGVRECALVLSRYRHQGIVLTEPGRAPIRIFLEEVRDGCKARIGIQAEHSVNIARDEVYDPVIARRAEK